MEPSELASLIEKIQQVDKLEFAQALEKQANPHFQVMFKRGFGTAKSELSDEAKGLAEKLEAAEQAQAERDAELAELRKKQPDIEKWKQEKEDALLAVQNEWKGKYEELQAKLVKGQTTAERDRVIAHLKEDAYVEPFIAESALAREDISSRMKVQPDGSIRYYQKDGQVPLVAAEGESAAKLFALSLVAEKVIPEQYIKPPRNSGGPDYKGSGTGAPSAIKRSEMTIKQKSDYVAEHGPEAYHNLPA